VKITWLIVNLTLFALFGYGTYQQIENQKQTNRLMGEVSKNITIAYQLTQKTNEQLKPLSKSATTIGQMNHKLETTHHLLSQMNQSVASVNNSEQKIITGLDQLNKDTSEALVQLKSISSANGELDPLAKSLSNQSEYENGAITTLGKLTITSISELHELNEKLILLSLLP
jgi:septal ring factor EnvC (AmiA/AmiB activator)